MIMLTKALEQPLQMSFKLLTGVIKEYSAYCEWWNASIEVVAVVYHATLTVCDAVPILRCVCFDSLVMDEWQCFLQLL